MEQEYKSKAFLKSWKKNQKKDQVEWKLAKATRFFKVFLEQIDSKEKFRKALNSSMNRRVKLEYDGTEKLKHWMLYSPQWKDSSPAFVYASIFLRKAQPRAGEW